MKQRTKAVLGVILVILMLWVISVMGEIGGIGKDKVVSVTIADGNGTAAIADLLKEEGVISHPFFFRLYTKVGHTPIWQKGTHKVNASMSYREIVKTLQEMPDMAESVRRVVIPEGSEMRHIVDLLVEQGLGERDAFWREIEQGEFEYSFVAEIPERENRLEGYLYPDTYLFSVEESEHEIIAKMLDAFAEKVLPIYEESHTEESLDRVLILASVIEREAANQEEQPQVSSVFCNRLKIGMKLESCATVQYILKERKEILSTQDIAIDSPYNTYLYAGLPVGPIASPGASSVRAALYPADTEYLYFVAEADGSRNLFSKTFEEHNQKTIETQSR